MSTVETEPGIQEVGTDLLSAARRSQRSVFGREHWEEAFLRRLMERPEFKTPALRFVDVLPTLTDDAELVRHLNEYFGEEELPLPGVARWGLRQASRFGLAEHAAAAAVRKAIITLAHRFIGGATAAEAGKSVRRLWDDGMAFTLDVLGEATVSEAEADEYQQKYLNLLESLAPTVGRWPERPLLDRSGHRPLPRLNLSVKVSALYSQLDPLSPAGSAAAIKARLRPILASARARGAAITFDMEQYHAKDLTLRAFRELLVEPEFHDWPDAGIALQAYLRDTESDLLGLLGWARDRGTPVTVRLVRGAYWDYETVIARQNDWPVPVFTEKWMTDRAYENCARRLLEAYPHVEAAIATHNVRSLAHAVVHARRLGLRPDAFELQMLYGMADPLKEAVVRQGHRLRVYVPFGELIPGMAYLVRRLLENTANQSFLRLGFAEDVPAAELLRVPAEPLAKNGQRPTDGEQNPVARDEEATRNGGGGEAPGPGHSPPPGAPAPFRNEPVHRFVDPGERQRFEAAVGRARAGLGREYPLVIGGREVRTAAAIASVNPARPTELVGRVASAGPAEASAAVDAALAAFPAWAERPAKERSDRLRRAAELMRARRDDLAAMQVLEVGKNWREADADVVEAIDFLDYYAAGAERLARGKPLLSPPGEANDYHYVPRGVTAVIPPWNFPLAILTGMSSAALAVGNTVVIKPASQSPVIAAQFMAILQEAGLPAGVANFVPGPGPEVGEALVRHPDVPLIAFTGSRQVGCRIMQLAAEVAPGQVHLKRVIAELGGKNALIVDSDADIDDAVLGTVVSAFGYQGQKCSACSRVIVLAPVYDAFLRRLVEATRSLRVGSPEDPQNSVGPVVEARARDSIRRAIEAGRSVAKLALEVDVTALGDGYWVGPTIFTEVPPDSPLAQEEIFGPVLSVMRAGDMDEAFRIANGTAYALTGGIFSRSPANIERARREFRVGNLYINRKITGAIVGRQPFGGFKLSGVGTKAGGPDYLLQFVEPRVVTENTIRRGFAPED
jgi:RHH-type proline utilization regulon transcriptional repressor/proline dehydrogenase/delta 1-pyrroline-5-carboxylate dehydrogenase